MLLHYALTTLRHLSRSRLYSSVNIVGLTVGFSVCILTSLWIADELSFDRFHEDSDRIYRVTIENPKTGHRMARLGAPWGAAMAAEFPQVEEVVRFTRRRPIIESGAKRLREDGFLFTSSNILKVFSFPLIKGDAESALSNSGTVVISESAATRYFGDEEPMNKVMPYQSERTASI